MYCYASLTPAGIYHPKLYLLKGDEDATCIIGSSNLTEGGLKKNVEVNAIIEGTTTMRSYQTLIALITVSSFTPSEWFPTKSFWSCTVSSVTQKELTSSSHQRCKYARPDTGVQREDAINATTCGLRKGLTWLVRLVYRNLPAGEFTNEQVYGFEETFQRHYPDNLNIRAKVRQQLQVLRDMGMVEHMGTGRWRKV